MLRIKNPHNNGLSLLEVIISLAIISLMLTPLLVMHTTSLRRTHSYTIALQDHMALNNAVSWLHRNYLNAPVDEHVTINQYHVDYQQEKFDKESLLAGKNLLYRRFSKNNQSIESIIYMIKEDNNA